MAITPSTSFIAFYDRELDRWIGYTEDYGRENIASESMTPSGALEKIKEMVR